MLSFYNKNVMEKGCLALLVRSSKIISGELCKRMEDHGIGHHHLHQWYCVEGWVGLEL
jgi:hypothetical protein